MNTSLNKIQNVIRNAALLLVLLPVIVNAAGWTGEVKLAARGYQIKIIVTANI